MGRPLAPLAFYEGSARGSIRLSGLVQGVRNAQFTLVFDFTDGRLIMSKEASVVGSTTNGDISTYLVASFEAINMDASLDMVKSETLINVSSRDDYKVVALMVTDAAAFVGALRAAEALTTALLFLDHADFAQNVSSGPREKSLILWVAARDTETYEESRNLQHYSSDSPGVTLIGVPGVRHVGSRDLDWFVPQIPRPLCTFLVPNVISNCNRLCTLEVVTSDTLAIHLTGSEASTVEFRLEDPGRLLRVLIREPGVRYLIPFEETDGLMDGDDDCSVESRVVSCSKKQFLGALRTLTSFSTNVCVSLVPDHVMLLSASLDQDAISIQFYLPLLQA